MSTILFVIDTLETGGAEKSILDVASRFKRYTPVVCHIYRGDGLKPDYERAGIRVIALDVAGHYNFNTAVMRLHKVVQSVRPAIIHSTLFNRLCNQEM